MKKSAWRPHIAAGRAAAGRIAVGLATTLAVACGGALDAPGINPSMSASADEPPAPPKPRRPPNPAKNTGKEPGGAFLIDFSKGHDASTQYISGYDMHPGWIESAFRESNVLFTTHGLTLVADRKPNGNANYTSAELQRIGFYGYGRYEAVLRASSEVGVITGFFTHTDSYHGDPHDEIDFELLGKAPREAHLNYFGDNDGGDPLDVPLWFDISEAEHLYAFEWAPESIRWFIDGVKVREVFEKDGAEIPSSSGRVIVSLLAGQGPAAEWTGTPHFTSTSAFYRCISHVPAGKTGPQCSDKFTPPPKP